MLPGRPDEVLWPFLLARPEGLGASVALERFARCDRVVLLLGVFQMFFSAGPATDR